MGHYDEQREEEDRKNREIACPFCGGKGSVYDPKSRPDCIEGNKTRPAITCNVCKGKGTFNRDSASGLATIAFWRIRVAERAKEEAIKQEKKVERMRLFESINQKLNEDELAFINLKRPENT